MGKSAKRKTNSKKKAERRSNIDTKKISALAKRYWYWLVVIPLLIVAIILFCYFQGYLILELCGNEKERFINLCKNKEIEIIQIFLINDVVDKFDEKKENFFFV